MNQLQIIYLEFRKAIKYGVYDDPNEINKVANQFVKLRQHLERTEKMLDQYKRNEKKLKNMQTEEDFKHLLKK